MHSNVDPSWLSGVSRRKLHAASSSERPKDADKLLRRVLLKNSLTKADLVFSETAPQPQPSSSTNLPQSSESNLATASRQSKTTVSLPEPTLEHHLVFPDASTMTTVRQYTPEEREAEARWLDSLLQEMSDDEDEDYSEPQEQSTQTDTQADSDEYDLYLDADWWEISTTPDEQPAISVPSPTSVPVRSLEPLRGASVIVGMETAQTSAFGFPMLPEDSDDDLSSPGMVDDLEGDSEADSLEWPQTPGSQSRSIPSLARTSSNSSLVNLLASSPLPDVVVATLPSIPEGGVRSPLPNSPSLCLP